MPRDRRSFHVLKHAVDGGKSSLFHVFIREDHKTVNLTEKSSKTIEMSRRSYHGPKYMLTKRNLNCCHGNNILLEHVEGMS